MALSARTAPPSGAAAFRDLNDQALATADGSRRDASIGSRGKSKSQGRAQHNRSYHYAFLPIC
jgi:hypothetical protein